MKLGGRKVYLVAHQKGHLTIPLTQVEADALKAIIRFKRENDGISPTYKEVGAALGFSKEMGHKLILQLGIKGWVLRAPGQRRNIRVLHTKIRLAA